MQRRRPRVRGDRSAGAGRWARSTPTRRRRSRLSRRRAGDRRLDAGRSSGGRGRLRLHRRCGRVHARCRRPIPTVAYGPRRQALAAWTQGTLNPSVVAAACAVRGRAAPQCAAAPRRARRAPAGPRPRRRRPGWGTARRPRPGVADRRVADEPRVGVLGGALPGAGWCSCSSAVPVLPATSPRGSGPTVPVPNWTTATIICCTSRATWPLITRTKRGLLVGEQGGDRPPAAHRDRRRDVGHLQRGGLDQTLADRRGADGEVVADRCRRRDRRSAAPGIEGGLVEAEPLGHGHQPPRRRPWRRAGRTPSCRRPRRR